MPRITPELAVKKMESVAGELNSQIKEKKPLEIAKLQKVGQVDDLEIIDVANLLKTSLALLPKSQAQEGDWYVDDGGMSFWRGPADRTLGEPTTAVIGMLSAESEHAEITGATILSRLENPESPLIPEFYNPEATIPPAYLVMHTGGENGHYVVLEIFVNVEMENRILNIRLIDSFPSNEFGMAGYVKSSLLKPPGALTELLTLYHCQQLQFSAVGTGEQKVGGPCGVYAIADVSRLVEGIELPKVGGVIVPPEVIFTLGESPVPEQLPKVQLLGDLGQPPVSPRSAIPSPEGSSVPSSPGTPNGFEQASPPNSPPPSEAATEDAYRRSPADSFTPIGVGRSEANTPVAGDVSPVEGSPFVRIASTPSSDSERQLSVAEKHKIIQEISSMFKIPVVAVTSDATPMQLLIQVINIVNAEIDAMLREVDDATVQPNRFTGYTPAEKVFAHERIDILRMSVFTSQPNVEIGMDGNSRVYFKNGEVVPGAHQFAKDLRRNLAILIIGDDGEPLDLGELRDSSVTTEEATEKFDRKMQEYLTLELYKQLNAEYFQPLFSFFTRFLIAKAASDTGGLYTIQPSSSDDNAMRVRKDSDGSLVLDVVESGFVLKPASQEGEKVKADIPIEGKVITHFRLSTAHQGFELTNFEIEGDDLRQLFFGRAANISAAKLEIDKAIREAVVSICSKAVHGNSSGKDREIQVTAGVKLLVESYDHFTLLGRGQDFLDELRKGIKPLDLLSLFKADGRKTKLSRFEGVGSDVDYRKRMPDFADVALETAADVLEGSVTIKEKDRCRYRMIVNGKAARYAAETAVAVACNLDVATHPDIVLKALQLLLQYHLLGEKPSNFTGSWLMIQMANSLEQALPLVMIKLGYNNGSLAKFMRARGKDSNPIASTTLGIEAGVPTERDASDVRFYDALKKIVGSTIRAKRSSLVLSPSSLEKPEKLVGDTYLYKLAKLAQSIINDPTTTLNYESFVNTMEVVGIEEKDYVSALRLLSPGKQVELFAKGINGEAGFFGFVEPLLSVVAPPSVAVAEQQQAYFLLACHYADAGDVKKAIKYLCEVVNKPEEAGAISQNIDRMTVSGWCAILQAVGGWEVLMRDQTLTLFKAAFTVGPFQALCSLYDGTLKKAFTESGTSEDRQLVINGLSLLLGDQSIELKEITNIVNSMYFFSGFQIGEDSSGLGIPQKPAAMVFVRDVWVWDKAVEALQLKKGITKDITAKFVEMRNYAVLCDPRSVADQTGGWYAAEMDKVGKDGQLLLMKGLWDQTMVSSPLGREKIRTIQNVVCDYVASQLIISKKGNAVITDVGRAASAASGGVSASLFDATFVDVLLRDPTRLARVRSKLPELVPLMTPMQVSHVAIRTLPEDGRESVRAVIFTSANLAAHDNFKLLAARWVILYPNSTFESWKSVADNLCAVDWSQSGRHAWVDELLIELKYPSTSEGFTLEQSVVAFLRTALPPQTTQEIFNRLLQYVTTTYPLVMTSCVHKFIDDASSRDVIKEILASCLRSPNENLFLERIFEGVDNANLCSLFLQTVFDAGKVALEGDVPAVSKERKQELERSNKALEEKKIIYAINKYPSIICTCLRTLGCDNFGNFKIHESTVERILNVFVKAEIENGPKFNESILCTILTHGNSEMRRSFLNAVSGSNRQGAWAISILRREEAKELDLSQLLDLFGHFPNDPLDENAMKLVFENLKHVRFDLNHGNQLGDSLMELIPDRPLILYRLVVGDPSKRDDKHGSVNPVSLSLARHMLTDFSERGVASVLMEESRYFKLVNRVFGQPWEVVGSSGLKMVMVNVGLQGMLTEFESVMNKSAGHEKEQKELSLAMLRVASDPNWAEVWGATSALSGEANNLVNQVIEVCLPYVTFAEICAIRPPSAHVLGRFLNYHCQQGDLASALSGDQVSNPELIKALLETGAYVAEVNKEPIQREVCKVLETDTWDLLKCNQISIRRSESFANFGDADKTEASTGLVARGKKPKSIIMIPSMQKRMTLTKLLHGTPEEVGLATARLAAVDFAGQAGIFQQLIGKSERATAEEVNRAYTSIGNWNTAMAQPTISVVFEDDPKKVEFVLNSYQLVCKTRWVVSDEWFIVYKSATGLQNLKIPKGELREKLLKIKSQAQAQVLPEGLLEMVTQWYPDLVRGKVVSSSYFTSLLLQTNLLQAQLGSVTSDSAGVFGKISKDLAVLKGRRFTLSETGIRVLLDSRILSCVKAGSARNAVATSLKQVLRQNTSHWRLWVWWKVRGMEKQAELAGKSESPQVATGKPANEPHHGGGSSDGTTFAALVGREVPKNPEAAYPSGLPPPGASSDVMGRSPPPPTPREGGNIRNLLSEKDYTPLEVNPPSGGSPGGAHDGPPHR